MKQFLLFFLILNSLTTKAQELLETPPGTIEINDSLFIDKGPIDNIMYLEFTKKVKEFWSLTLHDSLKSVELINIDKSLLSRPLNPDQSSKIYDQIIQVEDLKISNIIDIYSYFNHPKYYYNPVIGISKEQAQLFCQWRTDMVNLRWSTILKNEQQKFPKIKYRIPTTEEYKLAKKVFQENNKLLLISKNSPLEIDLETQRKKDYFIVYNFPEYSAEEKKFNENSISSDNNYTFFRCICEVEK